MYTLSQTRRINVLCIGEIAYDATFVNTAKNLCDHLHVAVTPDAIETMVRDETIDLIFGSLSASNEAAYVPVLQNVRKAYPSLRIVLFLQTDFLTLFNPNC